MTKITVKLSKNGFYYGSVTHTYSSLEEAKASDLVAHYRANDINVAELKFH